MGDKQIKIWVFIFVLALMTAGGISSLLAQKNSLYRGNEPATAIKVPVWNSSTYASVINTNVQENQNETSIQQLTATVSNAAKALQEGVEIFKEAAQNYQQSQKQTLTNFSNEKAKKVLAETVGEAPKVKAAPAAPAVQKAQKAQKIATKVVGPAPKVKIINEPAEPLSCEAQGKTTYKGEDKPGLLYGMCIK